MLSVRMPAPWSMSEPPSTFLESRVQLCARAGLEHEQGTGRPVHQSLLPRGRKVWSQGAAGSCCHLYHVCCSTWTPSEDDTMRQGWKGGGKWLWHRKDGVWHRSPGTAAGGTSMSKAWMGRLEGGDRRYLSKQEARVGGWDLGIKPWTSQLGRA